MLPAATTENLHEGLGRIISFIHAVQAVDTAGVEPLLSLAEHTTCPLRADEPDASDRTQDILHNSSETLQSFFVAPKESHFN